MNEVLQDLSAPALSNAIERNLFQYFYAIGKGPEYETHWDPDMLWMITNTSFSMSNSILNAQLQPENVESAIETVIERGHKRYVPLMWWTGPLTKPADLANSLEAHGFVLEEEASGMAIDIQTLKEPVIPSDLSIIQIDDNDDLKTWCHIVSNCFGIDYSSERIYLDALLSNGIGPKTPSRYYLGLWNGKPAAVSQLFLSEGVAGIYCVATLPAFRRRGIGAAITYLPLRDAQEMGYRVGILHAFEMGFNIYRSLGFQEYCKIGLYLWTPKQSS